MKITRRGFLKGLAGASGTALLRPNFGTALVSPPSRIKAPQDCGIEHVVVVMMENRSFDHFFGWLPNADGMQDGLTYLDSNGVPHSTRRWAPDWTGCGHRDPNHEYDGGRVELNGGAMDGFLLSATGNDEFSIGYYVEEDRSFYNSLARHYTTLDRYFCSILGPTFPNRLFMHAAQTDRLDGGTGFTTIPTIWDQLAAAGVSRAYYYGHAPFPALWGPELYLDLSFPYAQFLEAAATGNLPAVSFVDPIYNGLPRDGDGNDDHPHADIRRGDAFISEVFHALAEGPAWPNTALVVNYDEWGGFFDHVAPPRADAPNDVDPDLVDGKALLGFRVPTVIASPFSRGTPDDPRVHHTVFDHTSVLKLIEWRWGLQPLTARDASNDVGNVVDALDFDNPVVEVPDLPRPEAPPPMHCTGPGPGIDSHWIRLRESALANGWNLP